MKQSNEVLSTAHTKISGLIYILANQGCEIANADGWVEEGTENIFECGDWRTKAHKMLSNVYEPIGIGDEI